MMLYDDIDTTYSCGAAVFGFTRMSVQVHGFALYGVTLQLMGVECNAGIMCVVYCDLWGHKVGLY